MNTSETSRAVSPVVGVILVVAITVALSGVVGVFVFDFGQSVSSDGQTNSAGLRVTESTSQNNSQLIVLTVVSAQNTVEYQVNDGERTLIGVVGDSVSLTAGVDYVPGDTITVYSSDVLVNAITTDETASAESPRGLLSHWPLNDSSSTNTAIDQQNLYDGDIYGGAAYTTSARGSVLSFDGSDDYVDVGDHTEYHFGEGDNFSISLWFQYQTGGSESFYAVDTWDWKSGGWYLRVQPDGKINFRIDDTDSEWANLYSSSEDTSDNGWHHAVVSYTDNESASLYVDGEFVDTVDVSQLQDTQSTQNPLTFGFQSHGAIYSKGNLSDVRIYDRALSGVESETIYKQTK